MLFVSPAQATDPRLLNKIVASSLAANPKKLKASYIQSKLLREIWRVDGWEKPLIVRLGQRKHLAECHELPYERNRLFKEKTLCKLLKRHTDLPVPQIFFYNKNHKILGREIVIMECLPGKTLFHHPYAASSFLAKVLDQYVSCLEQIHTLPQSFYLELKKALPSKHGSNWKKTFTYFYTELLTQLSKTKFFWANQIEPLHEIIQVIPHILPADLSSGLIHADTFLGNILADNTGHLTGIIDWDESLWADPMMDLLSFHQAKLYRILQTHPYLRRLHKHSKFANVRLDLYKLYQNLRALFIIQSQTSQKHQIKLLKSKSILSALALLKKVEKL